MVNVAIIGSGYVGLCTGVALAEAGHHVTLVDLDAAKVDAVLQGTPPFHEPGLPEALQDALAAGRLSATTDTRGAVAGSEVTMLCVGTPQGEDGSADLSAIEAAAHSVGSVLADREDYHVVLVKSTVPPGTTENVVGPCLEKAAGRPLGESFDVGMNPEFLKEGTALADARQPDRLVIGARPRAATLAWQLYADHTAPKLTVDPTTAEMIKYAANAFLAVRIGLSNELANVCERIGVDWNDVAEGIGHDRRIGPLFLRAGAGFGGSCFPKDVAAIAKVAADAERPSAILRATLDGNETQPLVAVALLRDELGDLSGKRIALLGLAFKESTDDVRETRAQPIWNALTEAGADVVCHDPEAGHTFQALVPEAQVVEDLMDAIDGADGLVLQTAWPDYRALTADVLAKRMREPVVVDGRRGLDHQALLAGGVRYRAIGLGARR